MISSAKRRYMSEFERSTGRPIGQIHACKMAGALRIGAAAQVEFSSVICKCQFMPYKEAFEAGPGGVALQIRLDAFGLSFQHLGKAPVYFRVAARDDRR